MFIDFGFQAYAVREVSVRRNNKEYLANFIRCVYSIKILLSIIVIAITGVFLIFIDASVLGLSSIILVGFIANAIVSSFYPGWFFQGIEKIQESILPIFFCRLLTVVIIIAFVHMPEDIWIVPIAYCIGSMVLLIISYNAIHKSLACKTKSNCNEILRIGKEALEVFWSKIIIMGYIVVVPVMVKMAGGDVGVAIFNICEKAVSLGRVPIDMFANATYPRLAQVYDKCFVQKLIKKIVIVVVVIVFSLLAISWAFSDLIAKQIPVSLKYLFVYLTALIPIAIHSFIGTCVLMVNGQRALLSTSIIFGLLVYFFTYAVSGWLLEDQILRIIISMVMVEFGILFIRYFFSKRLKLI